MARLQGIDPRTFEKVVSDQQICMQIGNAMSVPVIGGVIKQALYVMNLGQRLRADISQLLFSAAATLLRQYIVDSGASFHLVDEGSLTKEERKTRRPMAVPIKLRTANGATTIAEEVAVHVHDLGIVVRASILKDTPSALSLGSLMLENDFRVVGDKNGLVLIRGKLQVHCPMRSRVYYLMPGVAKDVKSKVALPPPSVPDSEETTQAAAPHAQSASSSSSSQNKENAQKEEASAPRKEGGTRQTQAC